MIAIILFIVGIIIISVEEEKLINDSDSKWWVFMGIMIELVTLGLELTVLLSGVSFLKMHISRLHASRTIVVTRGPDTLPGLVFKVNNQGGTYMREQSTEQQQ